MNTELDAHLTDEKPEEPWLAPSFAELFPDTGIEASRRAEALYRQQLMEESTKEEERKQLQLQQEQAAIEAAKPSLLKKVWCIFLAILCFVGKVVFFLPLCILGLFGMSKHPWFSFFVFRDMLRRN